MNTNTQTTTPVAPSMGQQGSSTSGGHYVAYRACPAFALDASIELVSAVNPWRPNTPGHRFYTGVLASKPATVSDAIAKGKDAGFKAREVQNHLRWLYTWGGAYVRIGGNLFAAPPVQPKAPKAPAKGKGSKAPAKVS